MFKIAGGGWRERGPQCRDQRDQLSGDLLSGGLDDLRLGALANQLFQSAGSGSHVRGADLTGHTIERMRKPLGECVVLPRKRVGDLPGRRPLLLDELAEQPQIELAIAADT